MLYATGCCSDATAGAQACACITNHASTCTCIGVHMPVPLLRMQPGSPNMSLYCAHSTPAYSATQRLICQQVWAYGCHRARVCAQSVIYTARHHCPCLDTRLLVQARPARIIHYPVIVNNDLVYTYLLYILPFAFASPDTRAKARLKPWIELDG